LRCVLLRVSERGRLRLLGVNSCAGVRCTWIPDGDCPGNLSLGQHTGDGKLATDGETFLGRMWMLFFQGGRGRGNGIPGRRTAETFSQDDASSKQPWVHVIYHMLIRGGFTGACLQAIAKGVLDPRLPWADTCAIRFRQPVDLVHTFKTVKGLLLLVPSRTPRSSGYDVYAHAVYVVICYVSKTCYVWA
jgi:hypothetical protein